MALQADLAVVSDQLATPRDVTQWCMKGLFRGEEFGLVEVAIFTFGSQKTQYLNKRKSKV